MSNEIVKFEATGGLIELDRNTVRNKITTNPKVTDKEIDLFIALCHYQKLNPFLKEAYLIKYGDAPAQNITAYQAFVQRADNNPNFDGFDTTVQYDGNNIVSATTTVYRKDRSHPVVWTVMFNEYSTGRSNWNKMPDFMIRKVSLATALRLAFPNEFQGLYISEEMDKTIEQPATVYNKPKGTVKKLQPVEEPVFEAEYEVIDDYNEQSGRVDDLVNDAKDVFDVEEVKEVPAPVSNGDVEDKEMRQRVGDMLLNMTDDDKEQAAALLVSFTEFTTKDGKVVKGVNSLRYLKGKRLKVTYAKIKKVYGEDHDRMPWE